MTERARAARMTRRSLALLIALGVGVVVGLGVPLAELWLDCRRPGSDACVWGRALLGVSLTVGAVLGMIAGLVVYFIARAWLPSSCDAVHGSTRAGPHAE